ncbi:hypothetical protein BD410DRAFT_822834 [Rickenella mellea]|uniref:Dbl homology domain-containing protein n=1 Tax=Rickenella mellea TaxID=50990 RepID=A0A4Y7PPR7_9AGAM|nr:hypothetical protein BD410DRAFT_822834 [Rickenella mellea]
MSQGGRPHPHVAIPQSGNQQLPPAVWSSNVQDYDFPTPVVGTAAQPWHSPDYALSPTQAYSGPQRTNSSLGRTASFSASYHDPDASLFQFPEPQIHRSVSASSSRPSSLQGSHRYAKSDVGPALHSPMERRLSEDSAVFTPTQFTEDGLSKELSSMTLQSEEGLRRFQAGELSPADEEWHRLVPETAKEALGPKEVQRQSVLFEVFKSEREYVSDLEAFREVFIDSLPTAGVMPPEQLQDYVKETFWNLDEIISHHQSMLGALFARQRDQHPLIQSVTDVILETVLNFRPAYDSYIKHYPIAEARHRTELKKNSRYQKFAQRCMQDPRIKKRDLVTFISRPVTRLPRLMLVLEHLHKLTEAEHPDLDNLPLIESILSDFIKSTQPGIASSESKVKLVSLVDSLQFRKGEIIDMDLFDESRQLVHMGPLARRQRSEVDWHGWHDYVVALLDNYLLITRPETRPGGVVKHSVVSLPIPVELLRLGRFDEPSETRKERADDGRLLESLRSQSKPMYPFTVYHAAAKSSRRYTLYANSESSRKKWHDSLHEAIGLRVARQEANQWFAPKTLDTGFFGTAAGAHAATGRITAATPFVSAGKKFLAIGCSTGIYVGIRGHSDFKKLIKCASPTSMAALQDYNKLIVHVNSLLYSYSLDILARVSQGQSTPQALEASLETIAGQDNPVIFFRAGELLKRMIVVYACKSFRQTTVQALEAVKHPTGHPPRGSSGSMAFRNFGTPFYVPRQAYDMTPMTRTIAISTERGLVVIDPTNLSTSATLVIPDFNAVSTSHDERFATLKTRCEAAKPLGIARSDHDESLVIYEEFGCYVSRHGVPTRQFSFIRWETKASSFAHRSDNILLFNSEFVEIRNVQTGRLVQVIEGRDIRLLHSGPPAIGPLLIAMRAKSVKDDSGSGSAGGLSNGAVSDRIMELVETAEIRTPSALTPASSMDGMMWDEWDM